MTDSSAADAGGGLSDAQDRAESFRLDLQGLLIGLGARAREVVRIGLREHGLAFSAMGFHMVLLLVALAAGWVPAMFQSPLNLHYAVLLIIQAAKWLPVLAIVTLLIERGSMGRTWARMRRNYFTAPRMVGVAFGALLVAQTAVTHDRWKSLFGRVNPWTWDTRLAQLDRILHGGMDPWRLVHPVFGSASMTLGLDTAYWVWFVVIGFFLGWVLWTPRRQLRNQFLLAWVLMWILLGTVLAHLFASGGPAFYAGLVAGPNPYAELMAHLASVHQVEPLTAMNLQRLVWENAVAGGGQHWLAISAMPSLHVAISVLFALTLSRVHHLIGAVFWVFAAIIEIGSFYLGWHYAVDGYVGAIGVVLIWKLAGWALRDRPQSDAARSTEPHPD